MSYYVASTCIERYEGKINEVFQTKLAQCDKIIIRDGGNIYQDGIDTQKVLMVITDPLEVNNFIKSIKFSIFQKKGVCACYGWPGIDFYCGSERIMVTSVKHNLALSTPIANYDLKLTKKSQKFVENLTRQFKIEN